MFGDTNKFDIGADSTAILNIDNDLIIDNKFMISIHKAEDDGSSEEVDVYTVQVFKIDELRGRACDITTDKVGEVTVII